MLTSRNKLDNLLNAYASEQLVVDVAQSSPAHTHTHTHRGVMADRHRQTNICLTITIFIKQFSTFKDKVGNLWGQTIIDCCVVLYFVNIGLK